MTFYCPNCWQELHDNYKACPRCGKDLSSWEKRSYTSKLIHALSHPEPETQRRAVFLLGEKKIEEAVSVLTALFRQTTNPFLACEIIEALGKVGSKAAFAIVREALDHPAFVVRGEAVNTLAGFPYEDTIRLLRERSVNDVSAYVRETASAILSRLESDKAIADGEVLTKAIGQRYCPICLILEEKTHGLLCELQYHAVHDNEVKEFVIASGGYCRFHFWYLDRLTSPTTNAQLLDALLERIRIDFLNCQNSPQRVPVRFTTDVHCPVCSASRKWEEDMLALFTMKVKKEEFRAAYLGSKGLCLPHLAKVLGLAPDEEIRGFLIATASHQLDRLIEELRLQVTKWRNKDRSPGEEQDSTHRAVEKVVSGRNFSTGLGCDE